VSGAAAVSEVFCCLVLGLFGFGSAGFRMAQNG
jgi:hypothetical protein